MMKISLNPDFFISHKWHKQCDPKLVEPLVKALKERGFRVWYDKNMWERETGKTTEWMRRRIQNARFLVPILFDVLLHINVEDSWEDLQNLEILDLNWNQLSSLPITLENQSKLRRLFLRRNQLTQLPDFIGNLTSLTNLNVSHNALEDLPSSFESLEKLSSLWVNNNKLTNFSVKIGKFSHLRKLVLRNNPLVDSIDEREKIKQLLPSICDIEWD